MTTIVNDAREDMRQVFRKFKRDIILAAILCQSAGAAVIVTVVLCHHPK